MTAEDLSLETAADFQNAKVALFAGNNQMFVFLLQACARCEMCFFRVSFLKMCWEFKMDGNDEPPGDYG